MVAKRQWTLCMGLYTSHQFDDCRMQCVFILGAAKACATMKNSNTHCCGRFNFDEDGGEYPARIESIDVQRGLCVVDWEDGGTTCRSVPLASLSKRSGAVCSTAMQERPLEVQAWCVRRALRKALIAWEAQAQAGVAHDAF
eukprot:3103252-Amphidinium_carterae.1